MSLDNMPPCILRMDLEVTNERWGQAITVHREEIQAMIQAEIDSQCTPGNIALIIARQAKTVVEDVIANAIKDFYRCGKGREVIRAAVNQTLSEENEA